MSILKHSELIDRNALKDDFDIICSLNCPYSEKQRDVMCGACLLGVAFRALEEAPTIVEYEEGE